MSIADYNLSASLNTTVAGISIAPGMARSDVDNTFRQICADLADVAANGAQRISYGSGTLDDFLSGIIVLGQDVVVSANKTLDSQAFGRIHDVTAPCTIILPSASLVAGQVIVIRVGDLCNGVVSLSGLFAFGATELILWAQEEVNLEWTGNYYRMRQSYFRRMGGTISREAGNVALADGVYSDFLVDTPSNDKDALDLGIAATPLYFDVANKRIKAARNGSIRFVAHISITPAADATATLTICRDGASQNTEAMVERKLLSAAGRQTLVCEFEGYLSKGSYLIPRVKVTGAAGTVDNTVDGHVTFRELI